MDSFPFNDAPDTAVFTCVHVTDEAQPILFASHDEDGCWQFLCGGQHTEDDARIVSLRYIYETDSSIGVLAKMDCGMYAERKDPHSRWDIMKE